MDLCCLACIQSDIPIYAYPYPEEILIRFKKHFAVICKVLFLCSYFLLFLRILISLFSAYGMIALSLLSSPVYISEPCGTSLSR